MTAPLTGQTLGGVYAIGEELGAGGMGTVYAARHARTGRPYAVKVLKLEVAVRGDAMDRFAREAEAVGALHHANVVAIHDFHVDGQLAYLVMDRLEGEDLAVRMRRTGPMKLEDALPIFEGMAAGLGAAHARGLVHRDLKPANVFLARQPGAAERAVLLDFGLAKSLGDGSVALTESGLVMGTPQYMSPEQAQGAPLDARADLYALATVLYEMLTGRPPFTAPTPVALFVKLATVPPPPLREHRPDLGPALEGTLARALAKAPDERFGDAASLLDAVRAASGAPATPVGNPAASWPPAPVDPLAPTAATPAASPVRAPPRRSSIVPLVVLAAVFGVVALAGTAAFVGLYLASRADTAAEVQARGPADARGAPPAPSGSEPLHDPPAAPPPEASPTDAIADRAPEPLPPEAVRATDEAGGPSRGRRARRRRLADAPAQPDAVDHDGVDHDTVDGEGGDDEGGDDEATARSAPGGGGASGGGPPPGVGPDPGVRESVAYMGRQDWRGCLREARRHPPTEAILGVRISCALRIPDHDELREACREVRQRHPQSNYNTTCRSMMAAYHIDP